LEIGPLDHPLVERSDGEIIYIDHLDTSALKEKYASDSAVEKDRIVQIDAVWGEQTLAEALGDRAPLDYVIASHVIEHVPGLISWLQQIHQILKADGQLRLIVPDRRFIFNLLRHETSLADALDAYIRKVRKPSVISILDFVINAVVVDATEAWDGKIQPDGLKHMSSTEAAIGLARDAEERGTYHDVHCWVFTPTSFIVLLRKLSSLGLVRFACVEIIDTEPYQFDFYVAMTPCDDVVAAESSWVKAASRVNSNHD